MRYKYPHIIDGGVASSAPFFTVAGNSPRSQFWESVTRVSPAFISHPLKIYGHYLII